MQVYWHNMVANAPNSLIVSSEIGLQMDENVNFYLSTSPWSDMNSEGRPSCECNEHIGTNVQGAFVKDAYDFYTEKVSSLPMNRLPTQDALGDNIDYTFSSDLFSGGAELKKGVDDYNDNCLDCQNTQVGYDVKLHGIGSYSYNTSQDSKLDAPEENLENCNGTSHSFTKIGHKSCNDIGNFGTFFGETLPPIRGAFSLPNMVEENGMQAFVPKEGQLSQCEGLPSFATKPVKAEKSSGLPQSVLETVYTAPSRCKVSGKPRVRARRGQATDPHSIAERLRREKISERMKSLQELVPNPSKTDKASMLDEIIEYVRFLQLQVKVLSMSRLQAAEAVVPLIKHNNGEGSKNALILSSSSLEELVFSPTPDQIAFEREIVRLMETNVSEAVQCLQRKGLCLMPTALAGAISKAKAKETDIKLGSLAHNSSTSSNSSSS